MKESVYAIVDENSAKDIAIRFLEQHYAVLDVNQMVLKDGIWTVRVLISPHQTRKVQIDAINGRILDWFR